MKFKISVTDSFSAAHNLRHYQGKCERLHGHNFKVRITLGAKNLDKMGMVADFHEIKKNLRSVLGQLDHNYLNEIPFFKKINPTSEQIASFIFKGMKKKIPGHSYKVLEVTVCETEGNEATYQE